MKNALASSLLSLATDDKSGLGEEEEVLPFFVVERLCLRFCGTAGNADDDGEDVDDVATSRF